MLNFFARLRRGSWAVALLVLVTAFASGRTLAHTPLQEPVGLSTAATPVAAHCHGEAQAPAPRQTDFCKSFCAIGSQERMAAPATVVPAPSTALKFAVATPVIAVNADAGAARAVVTDTSPPPLRRLVRDRRLLI